MGQALEKRMGPACGGQDDAMAMQQCMSPQMSAVMFGEASSAELTCPMKASPGFDCTATITCLSSSQMQQKSECTYNGQAFPADTHVSPVDGMPCNQAYLKLISPMMCAASNEAMVVEAASEPRKMVVGFCGFLMGASVVGLAIGLRKRSQAVLEEPLM